MDPQDDNNTLNGNPVEALTGTTTGTSTGTTTTGGGTTTGTTTGTSTGTTTTGGGTTTGTTTGTSTGTTTTGGGTTTGTTSSTSSGTTPVAGGGTSGSGSSGSSGEASGSGATDRDGRKWWWRKRGDRRIREEDVPQASTYTKEMLNASEPKNDEWKNGNNHLPENGSGGSSMGDGNDDPAQHALGTDSPKPHNTDPFKGK
jgi:hypothetical protein